MVSHAALCFFALFSASFATGLNYSGVSVKSNRVEPLRYVRK